MSERDESVYFADMLAAARRILGYVEGVNREAFLVEPIVQDAVCRQLEILGEAAARIAADTCAAHPEIPWQEIVGMRNQLIHAYHRVDLEIVWRTIVEEIPELRDRLATVLDDPG